MNLVAKRLEELGIALPRPAAPVANYVPAVRSGALLVVSGQLPFGLDGKLAADHVGKLAPGSAIEAASEAARLCAINVIAQAAAALGDLDRVAQVVRLGGFFNVQSSFRRAAAGDERRLRPDGAGFRRPGAACAHDRRRRAPPDERAVRGRSDVRDRALSAAAGWLTARPIAHRGLHDASRGRIENTLGAADAAIAGGFAIECDVRLSSDGEAVVFHDATLDRLMQASGAIGARTVGELRGLRFKAASEQIPSLPELLAHLAGRVPLICEIKSHFDGDMRLTDRVAGLAAGYAGPLALKSFDPEVIARLRGCGVVQPARHGRRSELRRRLLAGTPRRTEAGLRCVPALSAHPARLSLLAASTTCPTLPQRCCACSPGCR